MSQNLKVPFFANASDNTHCFQAAIKMVLKYFWPQREFSFEELDKITAKVEGMWTWQMAGLLWLQENGFEVRDIEVFDFERFIEEKEKYLLEFFGEEAGLEQIQHSYLPNEFEYARRFVKEIEIERRLPDFSDIRNLMNKGYLVVCLVNAKKLDRKDGYVGHFVLIKGYDDKNLIIHDPGLPPIENRTVSGESFEKAWADPNEKAKSLWAIRLKKDN